MLAVETVMTRIESFVKQLEGLKFQGRKKLPLALQLKGHIEEAIEISESANVWESRVKEALKLVDAEPPKPVELQDDLGDIDLSEVTVPEVMPNAPVVESGDDAEKVEVEVPQPSV